MALAFATFHDLPAIESLQDYQPKGVTRILDRQDKLFGEIYHERRLPVRLEEIPPQLRQAIVAIEDAKFYKHSGISPRGMARALLRNLWRGRTAEGGSTLTQQIAKVMFLSPDKSIRRKLKELILAFQIEKNYSKDEILELYLNQIYLGEGNYGAAAAANYYFCKSLGELSLNEIASLAAIPKGPTLYAPSKNLTRNDSRRKAVLRAMADQGYISQDEYRNNAAQPLILNICPSPGVKNHVNEMILRQIENSLGENLLLKGQLTVESSIDLELQAAAEEALAQGIAAYEKRHVPNKGAATDKAVQAAMVVIEPSSGEIVALVGGRDYKASPFNRVTQAKRQNGSAFKPILYALAIDNGYNQSSLMQDAPATYQGVNSNSSYNPDNYSGKFLGPITLRRSLELSLNSVALQLASRLGVAPLQRLAAQLGINADLPNNLTIALGSGSVSLLELTSAYSSFFSNGTHSTPHFIRTVHTPNDEVLIKTNVATNQVLRPEVAYVMRDLLRGVVLDGTAQAAKSIPCFTAGKTGTSNSYRDALFIGAIDAPTGSLIPKLVAGVWIGFDDNHTLGKGESGMVAALPLWLKFAQAYCPASAEANQQPFSSENLPANIIIEKIDHSSGKLATERCQDTIEAAFIKGSEPHELCPEELP